MAEISGEVAAISRSKQLLDRYGDEIAYNFDIAQAVNTLWKHITQEEEETIFHYDDHLERFNALISVLHCKTSAAVQDFLHYLVQCQPEILPKMLLDAYESGKCTVYSCPPIFHRE